MTNGEKLREALWNAILDASKQGVEHSDIACTLMECAALLFINTREPNTSDRLMHEIFSDLSKVVMKTCLASFRKGMKLTKH